MRLPGLVAGQEEAAAAFYSSDYFKTMTFPTIPKSSCGTHMYG
jgi:hypothetical protein